MIGHSATIQSYDRPLQKLLSTCFKVMATAQLLWSFALTNHRDTVAPTCLSVPPPISFCCVPKPSSTPSHHLKISRDLDLRREGHSISQHMWAAWLHPRSSCHFQCGHNLLCCIKWQLLPGHKHMHQGWSCVLHFQFSNAVSTALQKDPELSAVLRRPDQESRMN